MEQLSLEETKKQYLTLIARHFEKIRKKRGYEFSLLWSRMYYTLIEVMNEKKEQPISSVVYTFKEWSKDEREAIYMCAMVKDYELVAKQIRLADSIINDLYKFKIALKNNMAEEYLNGLSIEERILMIESLQEIINMIVEDNMPSSKRRIDRLEQYIVIINKSLGIEQVTKKTLAKEWE